MPTIAPAHQGQLYGGEIKPMVMVAPTAPTNPTDRSISPIRSAYSSPMPNRMKNVDCTSRLTMLPEERKTWDWTWKKMQMTMSPTMMGRAPLSPLRMRFHQARR